MNRHCIPGLTISNSLDGELLCGSVRELKRCTQGLAYTYCIMLTPEKGCTEETGRYDLAWKDLCSVLNALSK